MSYYECKRCKYTSKFKNDMRRHLNRVIKCGKEIDAYNYDDNELYNLSLNKIIIKEEDEKKILTCTFCNKTYSRLDSLNRHKLICKKLIIENDFLHDNNITNKILKSFDEEWSIEHIDDYLKLYILLSQTKYTDFLKEIMKNDENLNIIVEKDNDYGLVYKKEYNNYIKIKLKEILEKIMIKINNQLQKIFNEYIDERYNIEKNVLNILKDEKKNNNEKLVDYLNDNTLKKIVDILLLDILNNIKDDAIKVSKTISKNIKKNHL